MKEERDYIRDISEMRSLMARSSRFLSLSGLAGVIAGVLGLLGAGIAYFHFHFNPGQIIYSKDEVESMPANLLDVILLALVVLIFALATAVFLSYKKALKKGEKVWEPTTRRLLAQMGVPLVAGGILVLIAINKGLFGLMAPFTLIFYGLSLYNASKFTYEEVKSLGLIHIVLGLISAYFVELGLLFWALGFGVGHVIYGIYIHYRYER